MYENAKICNTSMYVSVVVQVFVINKKHVMNLYLCFIKENYRYINQFFSMSNLTDQNRKNWLFCYHCIMLMIIYNEESRLGNGVWVNLFYIW